ncbi:MAG: 8-oxo-dGTP pyrophosphatase MutT (NUDIX family) [Myxococcota bacterium]|jgi:8-oxo-dGTP pyrophosphatase MutT (NUDIX family)
MGLIGGGVEPEDGDPEADRDGTLRAAACRELCEEAGIIVAPEQLRPVFEALGRSRWAVTFVVEPPVPPPVLGENEEGQVRWASIEELCGGSFADYNRALFAALQRDASA